MDVAAYLIPIYLLVVWLGLLATMAGNKADRAYRSLARLERKTDLILDHLGIETGSDLDRVHALAREGKTIHAVRLYRQQTGASMTEAKQAVTRMVAADGTAARSEGRQDEQGP